MNKHLFSWPWEWLASIPFPTPKWISLFPGSSSPFSLCLRTNPRISSSGSPGLFWLSSVRRSLPTGAWNRPAFFLFGGSPSSTLSWWTSVALSFPVAFLTINQIPLIMLFVGEKHKNLFLLFLCIGHNTLETNTFQKSHFIIITVSRT